MKIAINPIIPQNLENRNSASAEITDLCGWDGRLRR